MNYWLLLEKSDETRTSQGIDGYRDATGESYHYDSNVSNHLRIAKGDFVVIRKENEIVGVGTIGEITKTPDKKTLRRCPKCNCTDIRERKRKQPTWKCGRCAEEFVNPKKTIADVDSYVAAIKDFTRLDVPPTVNDVKECAKNGDGLLAQLSLLCLDPVKVHALFEGICTSPSIKISESGTGGQGFGLSQAERRVVELRAMQVARELYESLGWDVIDVSASQPFDLLATKNDGTKRYIEVKGTTGQGFSIILTHGEVTHISQNTKHSAIVIVSGIVLERDNGTWRAHGGTVTTHEDPWTLYRENLSATEYRYTIQQVSGCSGFANPIRP